MNPIQLEILPMEHITLDYDDLPADTTDGAFYRDMALDKLLHADEWEDLEMAMLANQLYVLSDDERMQIFNLFCKHCGSIDRSCQCWNDE